MSIAPPISIVWFRQDLRLDDNPALIAACKAQSKILPLYILDDKNSGAWKMGAASRWWLHHSLAALDSSLNGKLCIQRGDALDILKTIIQQNNVDAIYWNRCYEPWRIKRDTEIKSALQKDGIIVKSFNGSLLFEPHKTLKDDGTPYRVFTPFYNKGCLVKNPEPPFPETVPENIALYKAQTLNLHSLSLIPKVKWYEDIAKTWQPGEEGAKKRLNSFLKKGLGNYKEGRDYPSRGNVSRLSPHFHFGEISPRQVWHAVKTAMAAQQSENDGEHFLRELGWREFSHNLLFHFPNLPKENLQSKFDKFPWRDDHEALVRWQTGQTGFPIVDAGMRELWQTGYMHNRVRMIVGSFLVKNLLLHWHHGEKWFWDTLVDASLANNSTSWQWIAGCGADAAPYFRIFNPVTQGKKFDGDGAYVRKYVPEICDLPDKFIHAPWETPAHILSEKNITLGISYPWPMVDLKSSRERALEAFKQI